MVSFPTLNSFAAFDNRIEKLVSSDIVSFPLFLVFNDYGNAFLFGILFKFCPKDAEHFPNSFNFKVGTVGHLFRSV